MSSKAKKELAKQQKSARQVSKERLERITKTRKHHIRTTGRVIKYGTKSFARNTWLSVAAIAILAITLLVLSATLVATHVMNTAIKEVEAQVDMSIYIRQSATQDQIDKIIGRMVQLDSITSATAISPVDANNATIKKLIENNHITDQSYIDALYDAPNKLPWTINVKVTDLDDTSELENFVDNDESMVNMLDAKKPSYASQNREAIDNIASIMNRVQLVGLGAAGVFAIIAILVVFNTIRMAIFNRKEEIYMMKLVGASRGFISGPFLVEAAIYGIFAAVISGAALYAAVFSLQSQFGTLLDPTIEIMKTYWYYVVATLLAAGIMIGVISALLATRKYLKYK